MEINLIRHGESLANVGLSNELDTVLTKRGEEQAVATGLRLLGDSRGGRPFTLALVSPFRRTLMTYERIGPSIRTPARIYHEIHEFFSDDDPRYHVFAGLTADEIAREFQWIEVDDDFRQLDPWWPEKLESGRAMYARAVRARGYLLTLYSPQTRLIVISHAETIGRLVEAFLLREPAKQPPWTSNCGIWRMQVTDPNRAAEVILANATDHLSDV